MSICLKLRNPISLVKSHFLKPITTFNSFRVPISGLFTQSKRFNPDKVSHKHLKFLLVLPNGPNGRKLTLAPSSFYLGVRAMLAAKGGRKHFLISSKGSVLFAPTTLCWGQKLGVAQGRWGGGLHKSAVILGRVFLFLVFLQICLFRALIQLQYTNPQSTDWGKVSPSTLWIWAPEILCPDM